MIGSRAGQKSNCSSFFTRGIPILGFSSSLVPSAAVSGSLVWSEIDSATARATITHGGIAASGEFHFDDDGNVLAFTANRWMGGGQEVAMERWFVPSKEWSIINGVKIPTKGDVIWKLDSGDFNYYRWEITGIEYDSFELFTHVRSQ